MTKTVLVTGAATSIVAVGVLGFVLMLVGTFLVVSALRSAPAETSAATRPAAAAAAIVLAAGFSGTRS